MTGRIPKQLEANRRNPPEAGSTGPRTPASCVAAVPDQGRGQASDRGSLTDEHRQVDVLEDMLVEKIAVAHASRFRVPPSSPDTFGHVHFENAIERQLNRAIYSLQEHRCLFHPQPLETPPIDKN